MRKVSPLRNVLRTGVLGLAALAPAATALAQNDTIHWTDGTSADQVRVTEFTINEIAYLQGGSRQNRTSDEVAAVFLGDQRDVYARGYAAKDPGQFLNVARPLVASSRPSDKLMGSVGFAEAARLFYEEFNDAPKAISALEELIRAYPQTGYQREFHRTKLDHYLGQGQANDAKVAANAYYQKAISSGWPQGYSQEAEFYQVMAEKVAGELSGDALKSRLQNLVASLSSSNVALNTRCNLELADTMRRTDDVAGAEKIYRDIAKRDDVNDPNRAGAYLGLGHIAMARGTPDNRESHYDAMMYFLRVYVETKGAYSSQIAEALENGASAAKAWGGEGSKRIEGRLEYIHRERFGK